MFLKSFLSSFALAAFVVIVRGADIAITTINPVENAATSLQIVTLSARDESIKTLSTTYSCVPGTETSTADLNTGLSYLDFSAYGYMDYSAVEVTDEAIILTSPQMDGFTSGFFAPSEPGWYEFRTTSVLSAYEVVFYGDYYNYTNNGLQPLTSTNGGVYSIMLYAEGTATSGLTASYPFIIAGAVNSNLTLEIFKDGVPVNPNSVFYNEFNSSDNLDAYVKAEGDSFGLYTTICSTTAPTSTFSTSASTSSPETSATTSDSETSATTSSPETSATTSDSETSATTSSPETSATTSDSETSATTSDSETSATTTSSEAFAAVSTFGTLSITSSLFNSTGTDSSDSSDPISSYVSSEETVDSTEEIVSSALSSFNSNSSDFLTSYDIESSFTTELVTITSCQENKCSIVTLTTTYCPLTASGSSPSNAVAGESLIEQGSYTSTGIAEENLGASNSSAEASSEIAAAIQQENNAIQISSSVPIFAVIFGSFLFVHFI